MNRIKTLFATFLCLLLAACAATGDGHHAEVYGEVTGGIEHTHIGH